MDKGATKRVMLGAGIATPDWLQVTWNRAGAGATTVTGAAGAPAGGLTLDHVAERAAGELGFPLVVKLNGAGSSVGVAMVEAAAAFGAAFTEIVGTATGPLADIILERYIPGRELTAAILLGRRLPLLEIRPREGFYDFEHKYTAGASDYLVPAPVHSPLYEQIAADALRLYEIIGCRGTARVDFRLDGENAHCLEINTIPGMTATSLVPKAAAAVGIDFGALVEDLCRAAIDHPRPVSSQGS